jgi:hypothetical protein
MRFRGGGVGHMSTRERTETMSQEVDMMVPDEDEDNIGGDDPSGFGLDQQSEEEPLGSDEDEEGPDGDEDDGSEAGEKSGEQDDFDGEDGEEPWEIDEYTAEGYAPP